MKSLTENVPLKLVFEGTALERPVFKHPEVPFTPIVDVLEEVPVHEWYDPLDELPTITVAEVPPTKEIHDPWGEVLTEEWYDRLDELPTVAITLPI